MLTLIQTAKLNDVDPKPGSPTCWRGIAGDHKSTTRRAGCHGLATPHPGSSAPPDKVGAVSSALIISSVGKSKKIGHLPRWSRVACCCRG